MTVYPGPVPVLIGKVVTSVSNAILPLLQEAQPSIQSIGYMYDTYNNIEARLQAKMKNPGIDGAGGKFDMFPLICLIMPFAEDFGNQTNNYWQDVDLNIIFCHYTTKEGVEERYTKVFQPILLPMYRTFIEKCTDTGLFTDMSFRKIKHRKYELPFWGDRDGKGNPRANIFSNSLDAIEVQNLKLTVNQPNKRP